MAKPRLREAKAEKLGTLMGNVSKRCRGTSGGWSRNDLKVGYMNQRDLLGKADGVHVTHVAKEPSPGRSQSVRSSNESP